jgi:hypothetical protein
MAGEAELRLAGPADALLLSGDIVVEAMHFAERIDWEEDLLNFRDDLLVSVDTEAASDPLFALDIRVEADASVRLNNNVAEAVASASLHMVGDSNRPGMVGEVRLHESGRVMLQEREFEVSRAELHYIDPYAFDPELDFLIQTKVESRDIEYDIQYRISGPFSDWTATPNSEPALSQGDINALLIFGVTQDELISQGAVGSALLQEGADLFLAGIGLESDALELLRENVFRLDRVDLVSGVSERGPVVNSEWRLVVEKQLPAPWDLTVIGEFPLSNQLDIYWAIEKNVSRNLYTSLYWSRQQRERNLNIGGAYGLDIKLRWELE